MCFPQDVFNNNCVQNTSVRISKVQFETYVVKDPKDIHEADANDKDAFSFKEFGQ